MTPSFRIYVKKETSLLLLKIKKVKLIDSLMRNNDFFINIMKVKIQWENVQKEDSDIRTLLRH